MAWFGPEETDPDEWKGSDGVRRGEEIRSTYERALAAQLPYDRRIELRETGGAVRNAFPNAPFDYLRAQFYGAVDSNGRIKLNERTLLWTEERYRRFRRHYRREPEPTETEPFAEYTQWTREVRGAVSRDDDSLSFDEADRGPTEETVTVPWEECGPFHQIPLAELELVRNPPFARHRLRDLDRWEEIAGVFRYLTSAFDSPP